MKAVLQRRIAVLICAVIPLSGCAVSENTASFDQVGRVWPDSVDLPRIAYVGEFSNADDLEIREGFWRSVVSIVIGPVKDALVRPMDVAATSDAQVIFVADPDAGCVHRYDLGRRKYRCLTAARGEANVSAVGVTVTEDGHLFATDSLQGGIWQAGPQDTELTPFYTSQELAQPTGIHWRPDTQRLYVTDTSNHRVLEYDRAGNLKRTIGTRGAGAAEFNFPTYLWIGPDRELLVADSLNFRVQRFDEDAGFVSAFGEDGDRPGDFSRPIKPRWSCTDHLVFVHQAPPRAFAATLIARMIVSYPVHLHRLPAIHSRIWISVGAGIVSSNALAAMIIPGVQ